MENQTVPRKHRVRSGCLTCRARKKKCDEVKPRCSGCRRNQIPCNWPPIASSSSTSKSGQEAGYDNTSGAHDPGAKVDMTNLTLSTRASIVRASPNPVTGPFKELLFASEQAFESTSMSLLFISHYLGETSTVLASLPINKNPFVTHVIPMAYADDSLMHAVLALSGTHLGFRQRDSAVHRATLVHYAKTIQGVQSELANFIGNDHKQNMRLLVVLIIMCHYEVLSGDMSGAAFKHLRASRDLIERLLGDPTHPIADLIGFQRDALGLCLELYSYIVIMNSSMTYDMLPTTPDQFDTFVTSLDTLSSFATFGTMFGGLQGLFELIPQITTFASRRLTEEPFSAQPSTEIAATHALLQDRINQWTSPPPASTESSSTWEERCTVSEIYRSGLEIYLAASLSGSVVTDLDTLSYIQARVDTILERTPEVCESQAAVTLMWPLVLAGSCIVNPEQQAIFIDFSASERYQMAHVLEGCRLLQKLWSDPDPKSFGPYGLRMLQQRENCVPII